MNAKTKTVAAIAEAAQAIIRARAYVQVMNDLRASNPKRIRFVIDSHGQVQVLVDGRQI